ncbi:multidrug efflux RND transporter permease subunit [Comamonas sp. JUb58]|uniref:multidrug efflux RND transporter permease subunit n=1 Tax=Comamonas sp. JUb58 TaxID=2485114 RepID=UPI00105D621C|nr:multidrug efflux RND transporter permease subunit [Comamonas sp. JUb58]TDS84989.1 multidrug efflux pump [Comamonas sp. JUb58]
MSNFFINRPRFAWVVAIFIMLAGLLAIPNLPVAQFPDVAPPQISISATYPGASATTMTESVTSVIEQELNGTKNLLYFDSSSSSGSAEITVTFKPGSDPNLAQVDVQNRLKNAEARMPEAVRQLGLRVEQANAGFLLIYALNFTEDKPGQDVTQLSEYAVRSLNNEIRRLPGVGKVQFFSSETSMRVWVDVQKLRGFGMSIADVNSAIRSQNIQVPAGSFGSRPGSTEQELTATLLVQGMKRTPAEFGDIVLRANPDGSAVRLHDVARIETGLQDFSFEARLNGKQAAAAAVQLAPGANAIATAKAVKDKLEELKPNFPPGMTYDIPYDTSLFVNVAIEKVIHTLIEAVVLVFLVMFLFLQNIRYTLIPTIVVPVCLLGTLAVMYAVGFSVNMMTMFGMVLAIGILVDDAIVVVENVERLMAEEGLTPREATVKAMQQVAGAIIGITLVLTAVFLPLGFMSGSVGVIYRQFSLSLAVSILFSGFLALTLTPALCATLLKSIAKGHHEKKGFFGWFNRRFAVLTEKFDLLNHCLARRTGRYMLVYLMLTMVLGLLYVRVPETFVPTEDQGYNIVSVQLPPGATYARTQRVVEDVEKYLGTRDAVQSSINIIGFSFSGSGENAALSFPSFKDWSKRSREQSADAETQAMNEAFGTHADAQIMAVNPPPIEGLGTSGGFSLRLQDRAGIGIDALTKAKDVLLAKAAQHPAIAYAMVEGLPNAPQLRLQIDRAKAEAFGVKFDSISSALETSFGSNIAGDYVYKGRLQRVVVQAEPKDRVTPTEVLALPIPNASGELVPISAFATAEWTSGPSQLSRYNGYPAFRIAGDAKPGHSSGEAMAAMEELVQGLPPGVGYEWTGLSYQERQAGSQAPILFALAILAVFLLLVALYESWAIPVSVMLIVPIGALGSVLALMVANMVPGSSGLANDVYFKVGLITVVGLAAKNAILIVEFAKSLMEAGKPIKDAVLEAAKLRFRPIVMTSLAFILGVVPLVLASGAGAASQRSLGTGVIGGMLAATVIGVVFVPLFFIAVMSMFGKAKRETTAGSTHPQEAV